MNNCYNPLTQNPWDPARQYSGYNTVPQYRLTTNAIFVTSLEEALVKTTERNSDMIYFHQDKNEFYRVKVNNEGRKSWATFPYSFDAQGDNGPATKADIQSLIARIEVLEAARDAKSVPRKKKEVNENAESDG